jgi:hypothetical protein
MYDPWHEDDAGNSDDAGDQQYTTVVLIDWRRR